jgi:hypothetical protein
VAEVLPEDRFEVAPPEHQGPVEALNANGPHEPLCERVRARRADRRLDHLGTFRPEYLVETGGELRVPVPDEELDRATRLGQVLKGASLRFERFGTGQDRLLPVATLPHRNYKELRA